MSGGQRNEGDDGVISWLLVAVAAIAIIGTLLWLVTSNYIVYYLSPIFAFFAIPYDWLPTWLVGPAANDVKALHSLNRWYPDDTTLVEWLRYVNLSLKPAAVLWVGVTVLLTVSVLRNNTARKYNRILTPPELAKELSLTFSETAPVIAIQKELIKDVLPGWRKQVSPEEFLRKARYQNRSVLVDQVNEENEAVIVLDKKRLHGYLTQTKPFKSGSLTLRKSPFLGHQLVDLKKDSANKKTKKDDLIYMDRLSDVGKAIFAILAPHAFGGKKGRVQSAEVKDGLNYSAYGSKTGEANLSIPIVQKTFDEWRSHHLVNKLARIHHWEYTFLASLLALAGGTGKIGTFQFIWLKPMDRCLFYVLNTVGRATPHAEAALAFSMRQFEQRCARLGFLPLDKTSHKHVIFTEKTIDSFQEAWEDWWDGEEDDDDWWKDDSIGESSTEILLNQLTEFASPVKTPDMK